MLHWRDRSIQGCSCERGSDESRRHGVTLQIDEAAESHGQLDSS